jgi:ribonucleoside-diphosphate reductase alpha chain
LEIPLTSYEACNLSSINLSKLVKNSFTDKAYFDYDTYKEVIKIGVRFLDDVIDKTEMPLDKINKRVKELRRCGLGITGFADCLIKLGIKYGSNESKEITKKIAKVLRDESYNYSVELAGEKEPFNLFDPNNYGSSFIEKLDKNLKDKIYNKGIRNVALNTIAPVGTTSLTLGDNCSSGVEPNFTWQYQRKIRTGIKDETFLEKVYSNIFLEYLEFINKDSIEEKDLPDYFVDINNIDPYDKIDIISIWQK